MRLKTILITFLLTLIGLNAEAQNSEYGVYIQTYPKPTSEFTSLVLDNGNPFEISGEELVLGFKIWNRRDNAFGTVLRIITNQKTNIDLMYSVDENNTDHRFPMLVVGNEVQALSQNIPYEKWIEAKLTINTRDGSVTLVYNQSSIHINHPDVADIESLRIAFGLCPFEGFVLDNVASVNLKDIVLYNNHEMIRNWKMDFHLEDTCYDEINLRPAVSENAHWLLDRHVTWKKIYQKDFQSSPMIAFDSVKCQFYIANEKKELSVFHPIEKTEKTIVSKGGAFAATYPNQLMFIAQAGKLLSFNLDENLFSFFNPETRQWENKQAPQAEHKQYYWNNTQTYRAEDSTLVSFGGYGHFHYNNDLTISYPYKNKMIQKQKKIQEIHPRFSSASAIANGKLYVFGGRGCPSGKAELSPRNYYDLYAIDLQTLEATLLWDIKEEPAKGHFLPADNMIYDSIHDCFYVFCVQQGGILMKIHKDRPGFEPMSLPIYQTINAQYLYTNLYHSPHQGKLYAAIHQAQIDGSANLQIYEMDFPPFPVKALQQDFTGLTEEEESHSILLAAIILIAGLLLLTIGKIRSRSNKKEEVLQEDTTPLLQAIEKEEEQQKTEETTKTEQPEEKQEEKEEAVSKNEIPLTANDIPEFHNYDLEHSSIRFFGGFRVMDKEGNDITVSFTPTLKVLLILLILYTGKDPKGISGQKLIQLLWFDKMEESAKNNRNVYMSKLRNILEKVGDISIINKNGFWSVRFEGNCICDYLEALRLYHQNDSQDLERLVELLLHGMMLPNMEIDWIDKFKSDFSNYTIDLLSRVLKRDDLPDNFRLKIADTLFQHDYINEEALAEKCRILCKQGKKGLAKTVYDSFCKEYSTSLGTAYPTPLMDLIKQ